MKKVRQAAHEYIVGYFIWAICQLGGAPYLHWRDGFSWFLFAPTVIFYLFVWRWHRMGYEPQGD